MSITQEQKELLTYNENHFSSFLEDFQLPEIVSDLRVRLYRIRSWCTLSLSPENRKPDGLKMADYGQIEDGGRMWELSIKELGCNSYSFMKVGKYYVTLDITWVIVAVVIKIFNCTHIIWFI